MDDPFTMMLRAAFEAKELEKNAFESVGDAREALVKFLNTDPANINPGDPVERNDAGRKIYTMPSNNQAAICVKKIEPQGESMDDMVICVAVSKDTFKYFTADSRYYRVAGSNVDNNVFKFKKKGD